MHEGFPSPRASTARSSACENPRLRCSPALTDFAEIVSGDFPLLHAILDRASRIDKMTFSANAKIEAGGAVSTMEDHGISVSCLSGHNFHRGHFAASIADELRQERAGGRKEYGSKKRG